MVINGSKWSPVRKKEFANHTVRRTNPKPTALFYRCTPSTNRLDLITPEPVEPAEPVEPMASRPGWCGTSNAINHSQNHQKWHYKYQ